MCGGASAVRCSCLAIGMSASKQAAWCGVKMESLVVVGVVDDTCCSLSSWRYKEGLLLCLVCRGDIPYSSQANVGVSVEEEKVYE